MKKLLILLTLVITLNANIMQDIESFNKVLKDAKSGSKMSQYWVALRYWDAKGTQEDKKEAIYWLKKSAKQGYIKSMLLLGDIFTQTKSNKELELLGVKYFDELAHYDKAFPKLYTKDSQCQFKHREVAFAKLIELYTKGGYFLKADEEDKEIQNIFIESIKEHADVNATYEKSEGLHYSLLFYSIIKNNEKLFELLLSKGADIDYKSEDGKNLKFAKILYEKDC